MAAPWTDSRRFLIPFDLEQQHSLPDEAYKARREQLWQGSEFTMGASFGVYGNIIALSNCLMDQNGQTSLLFCKEVQIFVICVPKTLQKA